MKIMIAALAITFGGIIGFNQFKSYMIKRFFAGFEPPPISVSTFKVAEKDWRPSIAAVGNFVAINGIDLNAEASGSVAKIHFESGQYLEKGSPLIDLDDRVEQATLKFNLAELSLRKINYKRQMDLFKHQATSSSTLDEATALLQQAEANVERIEAEIKKKHLVTPFSGRLGLRQINLGQYLNSGQTIIASLQALDPLYLEFHLPEHLFKQVHLNQRILFKVEDFENKLFEAKITAINSKVDTDTHNIKIQASLANCPLSSLIEPKNSKLRSLKNDEDKEQTIVKCSTELNTANKVTEFAFLPGMFASLSLEQAPIPHVITLPSTAISYSLYGNSVYVIEKEEKKDKEGKEILRANRIFVSTGEQEGNYTVIKKGLKPGWEIVSSGELKLQNGARVVINNSVKLNEAGNSDSLGQ